MRGLVLFAKGRRIVAVALVALVSGILVFLLAGYVLRPTSQSEFSLPVVYALPLVPCIAIAAALQSERPDLEMRAARAITTSKVAFLLISFLICVGVMTAAVLLAGISFALAPVLRNVVGFLGLAILGSTLLGGRLCWIPLLSWVVLPAYYFKNVQEDSTGIFTFYARDQVGVVDVVTAVAALAVSLALSLSPAQWLRLDHDRT